MYRILHDGTVVFRCDTCGDCHLPFARLQGGKLMVESRHRGSKHENGISVADLLNLALQTGQINETDLQILINRRAILKNPMFFSE